VCLAKNLNMMTTNIAQCEYSPIAQEVADSIPAQYKNYCVYAHICLYWVWVFAIFNNLPILKGAYKSYVEVRNLIFQKTF
jgi:hypothetical protein